MTLIEACVTSLEEAAAAWRAGADRYEFCARLDLGGLTPNPSMLSAIRCAVGIPAFVMVRPRPGTFHMSSAEIRQMVDQITELRPAGANGLVLGVLDEQGRIDEAALTDLVAAAQGRPVTFHRAFDEVERPVEALETLIEAGVARVLTAGGPGTAWEGRMTLRELVQAAGDRITIAGAGGVRAGHAAALLEATGLPELHARASAIPDLVEAVRSWEAGSDG